MDVNQESGSIVYSVVDTIYLALFCIEGVDLQLPYRALRTNYLSHLSTKQFIHVGELFVRRPLFIFFSGHLHRSGYIS